MRKNFCFLILLLAFVLFGCQKVEIRYAVVGEGPPNAFIEVNGETYDTTLGSYCWHYPDGRGECADTGGPMELLQGEVPILVDPGATVHLVINYEPQPNEVYLEQFTADGQTQVEVEDHSFTVPEEPGVYYYSYGVWWMDEDRPNVSNGDAFYAFVVEVE